jgi:hypothetical protein
MGSLVKVEELVAAVLASPASPLEYNGLSDHKLHCQILTTPTGEKLRIATWNVMNKHWLSYCNGVGELPDYIKMEDQAQLESRPFCFPENQDKRQKRIVETIMTVFDAFEQDKIPTVLCLQECYTELYIDLAVASEDSTRFTMGCSADPQSKDYCMFLIAGVVQNGFHPINKGGLLHLKLGERDVHVANMHMSFFTEENHAVLRKLTDMIPAGHDLLLVGDYNIQCKPLSTMLVQEGKCTETLQQFVDWIRSETPLQPRLCLHPSGSTCYNVVKNCANPPYNVEDPAYRYNSDHFDNIMLLNAETTFWSAAPEIFQDIF